MAAAFRAGAEAVRQRHILFAGEAPALARRANDLQFRAFRQSAARDHVEAEDHRLRLDPRQGPDLQPDFFYPRKTLARPSSARISTTLSVSDISCIGLVHDFGDGANAGVEHEGQPLDPPFRLGALADPRAAQGSHVRPFGVKIPFRRRDDAIIRDPPRPVQLDGMIKPAARGIDRRKAPPVPARGDQRVF